MGTTLTLAGVSPGDPVGPLLRGFLLPREGPVCSYFQGAAPGLRKRRAPLIWGDLLTFWFRPSWPGLLSESRRFPPKSSFLPSNGSPADEKPSRTMTRSSLVPRSFTLETPRPPWGKPTGSPQPHPPLPAPNHAFSFPSPEIPNPDSSFSRLTPKARSRSGASRGEQLSWGERRRRVPDPRGGNLRRRQGRGAWKGSAGCSPRAAGEGEGLSLPGLAEKSLPFEQTTFLSREQQSLLSPSGVGRSRGERESGGL